VVSLKRMGLDKQTRSPLVRVGRPLSVGRVRADDLRSSEPTGYGAYLTVRAPAGAAAARAPVDALAERLGLRNEFGGGADAGAGAVAFLRRVRATPGDVDDDDLLAAGAVVHVAAPEAETVSRFCAELERLLAPAVAPRVMSGVARPPSYTGDEMHNFAYAHRALQQPGDAMPNAFLLPMSKTAAWWSKDWMERHTYFLPRYDGGRMVSEGHALAAAPAIDSIVRRTYKSPELPARAGTYEFLNHFECADPDVDTFHAVCARLRDFDRNPEWAYVREGPLWHGTRVATWPELFA